MSLKDMISHDNKSVFMNENDFAINCTIEYNGAVYENISAVYIDPKQEARQQLANDFGKGLFSVTAELYCLADDLGGELPEKDQRLKINHGCGHFKNYRIATSTADHGMFHLELEVIGE